LRPGAMSAKHRFGNWVLSTACRVLFRARFRDSQSGMWVLRREILAELCLTSDGMAFSEELKIEAFRAHRGHVAEVGIPYRARVGDVKLQSWRDGLRNLAFLFKKRLGLAGKRPRNP
ncbi:MAG: glycosyltransferase family 2 protein, partial [bacterium]